MCHLGEVATYRGLSFIFLISRHACISKVIIPILKLCSCLDEDVTKLSKVPCVLHMDPIRGNHTGLNGLMQR